MIRVPTLIATLLATLMTAPLVTAAEDRPIPPEEWRSMARGHTVYYYIDGVFFGREFYWPGKDMVTFQHASGVCADAQWAWKDGSYCFFFDRAHCFAHVRRNDAIVIIPTNPDDEGSAQEQVVKEITSQSFSCDQGLTS